jgi:hypothetical protein
LIDKYDLIGKVFGRLTVIKISDIRYHRSIQWECLCECGNIKLYTSSELISGDVVSCGCKRRENVTKHGKKHTKEYTLWSNIKNRCYCKNNKKYDNYGGRGIVVCEEWKNNFENFYNWCKETGYDGRHSIDRIDNNGNYEPSNCRWADDYQQANNKRNNIFITLDDITHSLQEWCKIKGLKYGTIHSRIMRGWSDDTIFCPITRRRATDT